MDDLRVLILGAAGRDFHNFNVCYRDNPHARVVGFTAAQIPRIEGRIYPAELAGPMYPEGIPIYPESELEDLIRKLRVTEAIFSYSDVSHVQVMNLASRTIVAGAHFKLLGGEPTMLTSTKPVVAVCAVRTGSGKSQTSRYISQIIRSAGKKVVVVRHPMPYGDLREQAVQRFATYEDLTRHKCTIEEREEYESHIHEGSVVYAGVDYGALLAEAEKEADVIIWDGGNNDLPFFKPNLWITVADPLRPGHELTYHPGEANLRGADVVVINKCNTASPEAIQVVEDNIARANPRATIIRAASEVVADKPDLIKYRCVLPIEDGPTLTHGGMAFGAGQVAADRYSAKKVYDPRPVAVGSIRDTFLKYPNMGALLPAMGYYPEQIADLEATINAAECDAVLIATPMDLSRLIKVNKPTVRVSYALSELEEPGLKGVVERFLGSW